MCDHPHPGRRQALKLLGALGLSGAAAPVLGSGSGVGALVPGQGWIAAGDAACASDGTPLQFMPKTPPDAHPLEHELDKYPRCPYCGMDRAQWHHSRHLVQYDDDLVDGTCSIHCLALSLMLNLDRGPKAIYAADFGAAEAVKPLVPVAEATYLIGSALPGTMTANSKMAFARREPAEAAMAEQGGTLGGFEEALRQTHADMARDTLMIRKRRAERRAHLSRS